MKPLTQEQWLRHEIAQAMIGAGCSGLEIAINVPLIAGAVLTGQQPDMSFIRDFVKHLPEIMGIRVDIEEAMAESAKNTKN